MRILVVYCHPCPESLTASVRDTVVKALEKGNRHELRLVDLYGEGFNPVMSGDERRGYHTPGTNEIPVRKYLDELKWAEGLVFVYPTWWFGLPAMLKGWLDRVWVPFATFVLPEPGVPVQPVLKDIRLIAAVSTCGAPWWLLKYVGDPGRRTLMRGIANICARRCRKLWLAHYRIDSSTDQSRARFLARVDKVFSRL